ncbi:NifU family protein [Collibacillus ludicampi]|uniref:NifU family protein n=1 Tax=Collibacillus ludicampi TaxID=2771369 RepID=UPI002494A331|nr:NifU family protein [Collibacillus ludicampi]
MRERVQEALDKIRPGLQADGGDAELIDVDAENGTATIRMVGACGGCPMSTMTLKMGIERTIRASVPEIKEVIAV